MKYIDLEGNEIEKTTGQDKLLKTMYTTSFGRSIVKGLISPWVSYVGGEILSSRLSTVLIPSFIKKNNIQMEDYEEQYYSSYNEFFTRKIRKELRPINEDSNTLISPSDGKVSAYQITDKLIVPIKNSQYTVASLIRNKELAKQYKGGYLVIIRLTVDDYHRYCYPATGQKSQNIHINGVFHTVNPIALEHAKIYKENTREYSVLVTENFGDIIQMEIGALMVGKIVNYHESAEVTKGQEKGRFEFGGSSIALLLDANKVKIREDLLTNTERGFETMIHMGQAIGYSK